MPDQPESPIPTDERKKFQYDSPADQAEGERTEGKSSKVEGPPDQAEGARETVEEALRNQERKKEQDVEKER
jgi:hypothetical protein